METGNYLITILTFIISYVFATWMFYTIQKKNQRITEEKEMLAIYEERERLAKELHDNIAQTLFLLKVQFKKGKMEEADSLVHSIDSQLRQAIFNLRLSPTKNVSFLTRIEDWLEDWSTVSGIDIEADIHLDDHYFSPSEEVHLFGVIQEVFRNIRKHSEANCVFFKFHTCINNWEMLIEDNGIGFNLSEIGSNQFGLTMLKERSERLETYFEIDTKVSRGTKITLRGKR